MEGVRIVAELSVVPLGEGSTSLSRWVARVIEAIGAVEGVEYELTPMGTILESGSMDDILRCVRVAHDALAEEGARRILSHLSIDDRRDVSRRREDKVDSVKRQLKP